MTMHVAERLIGARPWQAIALDHPLPIDAIPTPALLLDEGAFDRNVDRMAAHLASHGKGVRPHAKTHKCPLIAARQLAAGAVGICVAKVSEAWALSAAGVEPLLITSPVSTPDKADSIARLATKSRGLTVVVDSDVGVNVLSHACERVGASLSVLIDLDPLMGRTGVREPERVIVLAERLAELPLLTLVGVQHYAGNVMHVAPFEDRRKRSLELWERAATISGDLVARGFRIDVVSGGGTGTYDIDCDIAEVTDLQVGSYVFMDRQYADIGSRRGQVFDDFETSLSVAATVISQPQSAAVTIDCGFKGMAADAGAPVVNIAGSKYRFGGDEHGIVILPQGYQEPLLGRRVSLFVSHCDPTVNLYDYYWVHRDGLVHSLWPITARGCSW